MKDTLQILSKNFYETIEKSKEQAIDKEYISNTDEALNKGIFGAPSFSVGNEIFWGDDRLEDAIDFHRKTIKIN